MTDLAARDAALESVFAERDSLTKRTRALDVVEQLITQFSDEEIAAILDLPDVFMRAAQTRAHRATGRSPCGGPGRPPCGHR